jgi:hypothetical protein
MSHHSLRRERPRPTTSLLKGLELPELVEALAALLSAGRHYVVDSDGQGCHFDVFVTFERRAAKSVPCSIQVITARSQFALDDGADEFALTRLAGPPTFDANGNLQISALRRSVEGRRDSSLWLAHDLSMIAVEDEVFYL